MDKDIERLRELMSEISETSYCAGWMGGLEFTLWEFIEGITKPTGMWMITEEQMKELKELREKTGGWWIFSLRPSKFKYNEKKEFDGYEYDCHCYEGQAFIPLYEFKEYYERMKIK
jgi:hypothetical protein